MSGITLMSAVDAAAVQAAVNIVSRESIMHDQEVLLRALTGMCKNHKRITHRFEELVTNVSHEAPASLTTEISSYCPANCPIKYGPADRQKPALLIDAPIGEHGSLIARVGHKAFIAQPHVHRGEPFYAMYATGPLAMNLLDHYGKQGITRLERATRQLTDLRLTFLSAR